MLENGDLIFVKMSQIWDRPSRLPQATITMLPFVLDGMIYHASGQAGVVCQEPADFFESNHLYDLYVYPEMDIQSVKERACKHLGHPTMLLSIQMEHGFTVPSI